MNGTSTSAGAMVAMVAQLLSAPRRMAGGREQDVCMWTLQRRVSVSLRKRGAATVEQVSGDACCTREQARNALYRMVYEGQVLQVGWIGRGPGAKRVFALVKARGGDE